LISRHISVLVAVGITFVLTSLLQPLSYLPALAQPDGQCHTFRETGRTLCGKFLQYWQQNGGLRLFGYPISNPFLEVSALDGKEYTVQYFERAVFEHHPEQKAPYDVLLSHLGALRFRSSYAEGEPRSSYIENLPLYPGARDVKVERPQRSTTKNETTFVTDDTPEAVFEFYKDVMSKNPQWELSDERPGSVEFITDYGEYRLSILAKTTPPRGTSVRVILEYFPIP
jgi:hypothetical protein